MLVALLEKESFLCENRLQENKKALDVTESLYTHRLLQFLFLFSITVVQLNNFLDTRKFAVKINTHYLTLHHIPFLKGGFFPPKNIDLL